jgi:hypothetical protein
VNDDMLVAKEWGLVSVDGCEHRIIPGVTRWARTCPELVDPAVAALFDAAGHPSKATSRASLTRNEPGRPWRLGTPSPRAAPLTDYELSELRKTARHEAGHVMAALKLGWGISRVALLEGGGVTYLTFPRGLEEEQRRLQNAVITVAGSLACGWRATPGDGDDRRTVARIVHDYSDTLWEARCLRAQLEACAREVVARPGFKRGVSLIADELLRRGELNESECRRLLRPQWG